MNSIVRFILIALVVVAGATVWDGFFILPEGKQAVITQFGAPVGDSATEAGLHFKTPFIQKVRYFEKRVLIWDGAPNQIPTNDKTFVYLDTTARWRISDALTFLQAVNNETRAMTILDDIIDSTVRDLVNKNNLVEIIRSSDWIVGERSRSVSEDEVQEPIKYGRDKIEEMIFLAASQLTPQYGIELVDVMFKRVNYIESVRVKVYERMISERQRIAAEKRSLGEGQKAEILGKVQRELKEITSVASREAEEIKGKADAEASRIYADAYNKDPEFYAFSKSLESYGKTVGSNTRLILSTDAEFYKFLNSSGAVK
ncbi:MAG: protease modulator HflC [Desulfobulbaceae bacterium]|uniref:Protein HflC n=1 Tax=Candidatus Desulfobia pelagia TaxID=2841692 RepID=A0A8J6NAM2_9BACT|nr:protease modulator HflC [Candidatus Desulfobia pelagia]